MTRVAANKQRPACPSVVVAKTRVSVKVETKRANQIALFSFAQVNKYTRKQYCIIAVTVDTKKLIPIVVGITILLLGGVSFWYWSQKEIEVPAPLVSEEKGAVGTAKTISESVPEIETNVGEQVPEVNPLDRTNPFKYTNPLR